MTQKRFNKYINAIVVLSVLLVISLGLGITFAWFSDERDSSKTYELGDPIELNITNQAGNVLADQNSLPFEIAGNYLLPGMKINTYAAVKFSQSNTPALLRVRLNAIVSMGTNLTITEDERLQLQTQLNELISAQIFVNRWAFKDGWYYYLSEDGKKETADNCVMESVDSNISGGKIITLLDPYNSTNPQYITFPTSVTNAQANCNVTFKFEAQAVQSHIPDTVNPDNINSMERTIANAIRLFNETFI